MLFTLALVILLAAIFVLFSQEFIKTLKNIYSLRGAAVILPIALASWFIYKFNDWVLWAFYYSSEALNSIKTFLMRFIPFQSYASPIASILILSICSVAPIFLLNIWAIKKTYKPYPYPYLTSTLIWIIVFILLEIM